MKTRWSALALIFLCVACQKSVPASVLPQVQVGDPAAAAGEAMLRREWNGAVPLFRQAIANTPDAVALHYRLAVCASHLDLRGEALREFRWTLEHATAGSEEATVSRNWLAQAGGLAAGVVADDRSETQSAASDGTGPSGSVRGVVGAADSGRPLDRQLLHLVGLQGTPTHGLRHSVRSDVNGRYEFLQIVPGPYKLTDAIAGAPTWRLRVAVSEAQEVVVDLGRNNTATVRDDFPEPASSPSDPAPQPASRPTPS